MFMNDPGWYSIHAVNVTGRIRELSSVSISTEYLVGATVVFGIAHLLGIKLMPRIRDINSLIMFNPDRRQAYEHIDAILSDGINYDLIRNHDREMLCIIISIKLGKVTASTIIR